MCARGPFLYDVIPHDPGMLAQPFWSMPETTFMRYPLAVGNELFTASVGLLLKQDALLETLIVVEAGRAPYAFLVPNIEGCCQDG